jgi:predicted DNA-binding protein
MLNQELLVPKQFTTRLDVNLYNEFTDVADRTLVPKATLVRKFIEKGIQEINEVGITRFLNNEHEVV